MASTTAIAVPVAANRWTVLQFGVPEFLEETIAGIVAFLPRLVGAVIILLIGWIVGVAVGRAIRAIADRIQLDRAVLDTPIGNILGGTEQAVSNAFGTLGKWFVYAVAILAAANVLAIPTLSEWIAVAVSYLPAFVAGLLVIVVGFVVADFLGDAIMRTRAATQTAYTSWFAAATRMFLYFTAIVIGLETMGVDVGILYVFANALAWGLAAAIAIGVGVALGWGGHTYVADHIGDWVGRVSGGTPRPSGSSRVEGGTSGNPSGETTLTAADEGKRVVTAEGDEVGVISEVRGGTGYVYPNPGTFDAVRAKLDWGDIDDGAHPLDADDVASVTEDEVRLR